MVSSIPIIIPAYEPDERMIELLNNIRESDSGTVIIVDDGSGTDYERLFSEAKEIIEPMGGVVLKHEHNCGKGRALKTAFAYVLDNYPDAVGVVTADSDGQHTVECIHKVSGALLENPESLILGVRNFDSDNIPWKSEFGNKLTAKVLGYVSGIRVSDTQTGLRGIPRGFLTPLLGVSGERFEYETRMLLESYGKYPIKEVPIRTIYDSETNHQTHFDPFKDSLKIYKILGERFLLFIFASLSSSILDLCLFSLFCYLFKPTSGAMYITISTVLARIISATYNYAINYKKVFHSEESIPRSAVKYACLAVIQMACSAILVTGGVWLLSMCPEIIIKIVVDTFLFFVSYKIQQKIIFARHRQL